MALTGRITGRVSEDGQSYELIQNGEVRQSIPIGEAQGNQKLRATIQRLKWEALP